MYHTLSAWDAYNNLAPQKAGCSRIVQRLFAGCIVIFDDEKSYQLFNFNGKKKTDHSQKKKIWHDAWDFMMGQILACFWISNVTNFGGMNLAKPRRDPFFTSFSSREVLISAFVMRDAWLSGNEKTLSHIFQKTKTCRVLGFWRWGVAGRQRLYGI